MEIQGKRERGKERKFPLKFFVVNGCQATIPHAEEIVQKYSDEAGTGMEEIIMNANIEEYDFDLDEAPDVPEVFCLL